MLLLFSVRVAEIPPVCEKCSFGLLCVYVCVFASFPFGFEGGMWDLMVLLPGHSLSFYFASVQETN